MKTTFFVIIGATSLLVAGAKANTITFDTPSGATTSGGGVDASAQFVTGTGTLTITLMNLEANAKDVAQLVSDLSFGLSSGQTSGTLASSMGLERSVDKNGGFTDGSVVDTGWALNGLTLNVLGTPIGPSHLVIGAPDTGGQYSNANGSIAGNKAHNSFLAGPVTFVIDIPTLTSADSVNSATFSFGTDKNPETVTGIPNLVNVPDGGTTIMLLGLALSGIGLVRRQRI